MARKLKILGVHTNDKAIDKLISFVAELCHESKSGTIGVRGVFLPKGGGISQPSMLLACFNSAGGANAGL